MGRGRAKAKQQKVARELKYNSHHTDLDALQRELRSSSAYEAESADFDADADDNADAAFDRDDERDEWADSGRAR